MRLNTKCSIAMHCLVFIFEYQEKVKVTSELLAKSTGCNPAAIRSILGVLQKENIIAVARGVGGAHLMRFPETLTAWEVYHAVEPEGLEHLMGIHPRPSLDCPVGRRIKPILEKPYQDIGAAVQAEMEKITLQQLLDDYHRQKQIEVNSQLTANK